MYDDVYLLPVINRMLLFSPRRNLAGLVNAAAVKAIAEAGGNRSAIGELSPELSDLLHGLSVSPADVPLRQGPPRPVFLGLILTRNCNMACRYCDFHRRRGEDEAMAPSLLAAAIDAWVNHIRTIGDDRLELHFFGGEPFTEPELVQIAVHRTRALAAAHNMQTHFEASTNGLLDDRTLGFVTDYFDAIVLSLDGMQDEQDLHRPLATVKSGFDRVARTAHCLSDSPVELCLRCCVSNATVSRMEQIARWFVETFRPSVVNFEPLRPTAEATAVGLRPPDPWAFAAGFIRARRVIHKAGAESTYSALFNEPHYTFCPVGRDAFIVSPAGSVRSCYLPKQQWVEKGLDLEIGCIAQDGRLAIDQAAVERLRQIVMDRPRCKWCFCRWSCAGGCSVSETFPGHGLQYTDFCLQTRLIQACVLLEEMGMSDLVDRLLDDRESVEALCRQADDRCRGDG
jgi:uncharacterized protein